MGAKKAKKAAKKGGAKKSAAKKGGAKKAAKKAPARKAAMAAGWFPAVPFQNGGPLARAGVSPDGPSAPGDFGPLLGPVADRAPQGCQLASERLAPLAPRDVPRKCKVVSPLATSRTGPVRYPSSSTTPACCTFQTVRNVPARIRRVKSRRGENFEQRG